MQEKPTCLQTHIKCCVLLSPGIEQVHDIPDAFDTPLSYSAAFMWHVAEEVRAQLQQALTEIASTRSHRLAITKLKEIRGSVILSFSLHEGDSLPMSLLKPTDIALLSSQPLLSPQDLNRSTLIYAIMIMQGGPQQGDNEEPSSCRVAQMYVDPDSPLEKALEGCGGSSSSIVDWVVTPLGSLATPGRVSSSLQIISTQRETHTKDLLDQIMCREHVMGGIGVPMYTSMFGDQDPEQAMLYNSSGTLVMSSLSASASAAAAGLHKWDAATFDECIGHDMNTSQAMAVATVSHSLLTTLPNMQSCAAAVDYDEEQAVDTPSAAIHMIQGPPGTGKTSTIVRMLCVLASHGNRVLMCAPTNVAVAEVAHRLLRELKKHAAVATKAVEGDLAEGSPLQLADVFLVGSPDRMDREGALAEILLDDRAARLAGALNPYANSWGPCVTSLRTLLQEGPRQWASQDAPNQKGKPHKLFKSWVQQRMKHLVSELHRLKTVIKTDLPTLIKNPLWLPAVQRAFESIYTLQEFMRHLSDPELKQLLTDVSLMTSTEQLTQPPAPSPDSVHHSAAVMLQALVSTLRQLPPPVSPTAPRLPGSISKRSMKAWLLPLARVIFCTVSAAGAYALRTAAEDNLVMDVCIIDEASQLVEAEASIVIAGFPQLRAMVLVGDHKQLPATVISQSSKNHGYGRSLFERLQVSN